MANDKNKRQKRKKDDRGPRLEFTQKKIITPEFRGQFVHRLFTPSKDDKYSVCAIFEADADRTQMKREIVRVAKEAFGKWKKGMGNPFRSGEEKKLDDDGDGFPGFTDENFFCNLATYKQPGIRDLHRRPLDDDSFDDGDIKSGDYFKAAVIARPYVYEGKKGVSFMLCSLLWTREGDPLFEGGAESNPLEDFKNEFSDDADDFDEDNDGDGDDDLDDLID